MFSDYISESQQGTIMGEGFGVWCAIDFPEDLVSYCRLTARLVFGLF